MNYESTELINSQCLPGVWFRVRRMSLGRRLELSIEIGKLLRPHEFHAAGAQLPDQVEAARLALEIEHTYLRWGVCEVGGLDIDGQQPDVTALIERGPEELVREILGAVKHQCGLSDDERKN